MSPEILSILILVVIFIIATTLPINMGVLHSRLPFWSAASLPV